MTDVSIMEAGDHLIEKPFVVIDIQGYLANRGRFICKEFCLIDEDFIYHKIVKSPFSSNKLDPFYKNKATRSFNCLHGLRFDFGNTDPVQVLDDTYIRIMQSNIKVFGIFVSQLWKHRLLIHSGTRL